MPTNHHLSVDAFAALARGDGDASVVQQLREAQHSKHLMLVHIVAEAAEAAPASRAVAALQAGHKLLTAVQASDPASVAWLLSLPHIGAWGHDCLTRLDQTLVPDFAYLAGAAAAAAVRADVGFDLDLPVRDGRVLLPGLGYFHDVGEESWTRVTSDGKRLSVRGSTEVSCADITPDDGRGAEHPHWTGSRLIRAVAGGQAWEVLLETADPHLDRYTLPMMTELTAKDIAVWQEHIQCAWRMLVEHHGWACGPVAEGVSVIVPTISRSDTDLDSSTTPAAFGAIATSLPPDPVIMTETLVHEFQHLKLGAVMDLVRLIEPGGQRVYAPWRPDPRPASGLLQGVYAHLGVARFWEAQRHVEAEPDDAFRAQLMYERWRPTIELSAKALLRAGCLTPEGSRFVEILRDRGLRLESGGAPGEVREIAEEVALDHWLTWQLRHLAADDHRVAELAASYQRGESLGHRPLPQARVKEDARQVDSTARSRLLNMRYLEPRRHIELRVSDVPGITEADVLLFNGEADAAVKAYQEEILATAYPVPDAWIGLALAVRRLGATPARETFAACLPLIFDVHGCLSALGVKCAPLALADWFAGT